MGGGSIDDMSEDSIQDLDFILDEPSSIADVRDMLGGNPRNHNPKRDKPLDLYILARAIGHEPPEVIDALQQRGYDTTEVTDRRCEDVYRMKLGVAVNEVTAAMQMQAIPLEPAKTGNSKPNNEFYWIPKGKLHLAPARQREIFDQ